MPEADNKLSEHAQDQRDLEEIRKFKKEVDSYGPLGKVASWLTIAAATVVGTVTGGARGIAEGIGDALRPKLDRKPTTEEIQAIAKEAIRHSGITRDLRARVKELKKTPEGRETLKDTADYLKRLGKVAEAQNPGDKADWQEKVTPPESERIR